MTQVTETDLKEIKDLINKIDSKVDQVNSQMNSKFEQFNSQMNSKFEQFNSQMNSKFEQFNSQMNSKFEQVNDKLNDMKVEMATLKEGQNSLNTRMDDFNKKIDKMDSYNSKVFTSVLVAIIITLLAGLIKWVAPSFVG